MSMRQIFSQTFMTMATVVLVIISAAIETDVFVPSLPAIKDHFGTTETWVQMIIGINFLGLCVSGFFYGPLSDAYGRRPVLLAGLLLFALSSVACLFAESMTSLLCWRFVQGMGSSVAFVVPSAIIYDVYDQERAAKVMGIYNSFITFVMAFAPITGSWLQMSFGWHANFVFVAVIAVLSFVCAACFIHETLAVEKRQHLDLAFIFKGFKDLMLHPVAMANLYIICVLCGAYFAYISNLSLIFIDHLGVDNYTFAYCQGFLLLVFATISFLSGHIIERIGIARTRAAGKTVTVLGATALMAVALLKPNSAWMITFAMSTFGAGFAVMLGIMFGDYMNVYPHIKGIAASLSNSIRLLAMCGLIAISGMLFNGTILPVAIIVFGAGLSSLGAMYWLQRKQ